MNLIKNKLSFTKETLDPIFIYAGWRTGGSAFAFAFRNQEKTKLYYDPLNRALMNPKSALEVTTDSWDSNHPENLKYFQEFENLINADGQLSKFPELNEFTYVPNNDKWDRSLLEYLTWLIKQSADSNQIPVFKFEQLEGRITQLRSWFPTALHIAVQRDSKKQFLSFLEQAAYGRYGFFEAANKMVNPRQHFDISKRFNFQYLNEIFDSYYNMRKSLIGQADVEINVSSIKNKGKDAFLDEIVHYKPEYLDLFRDVVDSLQNFKTISTDFKLEKALHRVLLLEDTNLRKLE